MPDRLNGWQLAEVLLAMGLLDQAAAQIAQGAPLLVSTHTLALQAQLKDKDAPLALKTP